jgi:Porin PorA
VRAQVVNKGEKIMRRAAPLISLALGAFLFVGAIGLRLYVYPRVAVAPVDQKSTTTLIGKDANILDVATLKNITTDLTTTVLTHGVYPLPKDCPDNTAIYVNTTTTTSSDGVVRSKETDRAAFDQRTDLAVNCGGEFNAVDANGTEDPIKHAGYMYKLPINTQKKSYAWWDDTLRTTAPINYKGTEKIKGTTVYRFEGSVPETKYGTQDVPGSLVGEPDVATVTADEMYSVSRTLWVEPNTGVVINRIENVKQALAVGGVDKIITSQVSTQYSPSTVSKMLDDYASKGKLLGAVRTWVPWTAGILGVLLMLGGVTIGRRQEKSDQASSDKVEQLV